MEATQREQYRQLNKRHQPTHHHEQPLLSIVAKSITSTTTNDAAVTAASVITRSTNKVARYDRQQATDHHDLVLSGWVSDVQRLGGIVVKWLCSTCT